MDLATKVLMVSICIVCLNEKEALQHGIFIFIITGDHGNSFFRMKTFKPRRSIDSKEQTRPVVLEEQ